MDLKTQTSLQKGPWNFLNQSNVVLDWRGTRNREKDGGVPAQRLTSGEVMCGVQTAVNWLGSKGKKMIIVQVER
jgi:hypothetical protein